jgi:hypothetical protein
VFEKPTMMDEDQNNNYVYVNTFSSEMFRLAYIIYMSWDSSVTIVTRLWMGDMPVNYWYGQQLPLFPNARLALGPTHPPIQWVPEFLPQR